MAILTSGKGPAARLAAGDLLLERAKHQNTKPVAARLKAFAAAHVAYARAYVKAEAADGALTAQEQKIGEADDAQDAAVDALAAALAGDGLPRDNPFKGLAASSPSVLKRLGYGAEATALGKLSAAVAKKKGFSARTRGAAAAAEKCAGAVKRALAAKAPLLDAQKKALAARNVLGEPWETNFAALKRAVRAAEDDGAKGLFQALFAAPPATSAPKPRKPKPAPAPAPAAPPTPPPVPPPATPE